MNITEKIKELETQNETSEKLLIDIKKTIKENNATIRQLRTLEEKANKALSKFTVTLPETANV